MARLPNWEIEKLRMEHEKKQAELTRQREEAAYWTRLEHQYAGMAMHALTENGIRAKNREIAGMAAEIAHALVEKLKEDYA